VCVCVCAYTTRAATLLTPVESGEKRKQKLALLDQLLQPEHHQDSWSSCSEPDSNPSTIPFEHDRRPSGSPAPSSEAPLWSSRGYSVVPIGHLDDADCLEEHWADMVGDSNYMFDDGAALETNADSTRSLGQPIETSLSYLPIINTLPSLPLSQALTDPSLEPFPSHTAAQHERLSPTRMSITAGEGEAGSRTHYPTDSPFVTALQHFARLSSCEQSELVTLVAKHKETVPECPDGWAISNTYATVRL
jgi:hypothetical protein